MTVKQFNFPVLKQWKIWLIRNFYLEYRENLWSKLRQVAGDINRSNKRSAGNRMRVACFRQNEHLEHLPNDNEHTVGLVAGHGTVCFAAVGEFRCFCIGQCLPVPRNPEKWLRSQLSRQLGAVPTFLQLGCSAIFWGRGNHPVPMWRGLGDDFKQRIRSHQVSERWNVERNASQMR